MKLTDSLGVPVDVGDYVVFTTKTKTKYIGSLSIGRVTKISDRKVFLSYINTYGRTIASHQAELQAHHDRLSKGYSWYTRTEPEPMVQKTRLNDLSSTYKISVVPMDIQQMLSGELDD